jgi:hypothetical protein
MLKKLVWLSMMLIAAAEPSSLTAAQSPAPAFAPGQIWSIKSMLPTTAKVVINRVETWEHQVVVHVSIIDVPIPRNMPSAGRTTDIGHMPFQQSALAASVDRLLATGALPASCYESGYKEWQDAKGGVFTINVEQAIKVVFQALSRRQG